MKYLRYISIILFKTLSKVIGLFWYWIALPFRGYARNTIYNYVLQNNIHLPRLYERNPELKDGYYDLDDVHGVASTNGYDVNGLIQYREVDIVEYYLVLWLLWIWLDDDSNHDTMSGDYIPYKIYGNSFDLGDMRAQFPEFEIVESTKWMIRNTAYNFNYMFEEIAEDSEYNFYIKFEKIGWHFGFIPYTNSTRQGRLVWFSEDYDKLD